MKLTRFVSTVFFILFLVMTAQKARSEEQIKAAQKAGDSWLALVDSENYPEAWKGFSNFFKERMPLEKWRPQITSVKNIFGKVENRKFKNGTETKTLTGMPDGDYAILQYETAFEKKKNALETVTLVLEKNGKWGVTNYNIK